MSQTTIKRELSTLRRHAERIVSSEPVVYADRAIGDEHPQGDVKFTRLAALPAGAKRIDKPSAQLAPGTTQGSRHVLNDMNGIELYQAPDAGPLDGPIIVSECPFTVDHPEHAVVTFPAGIEAVTYQRAFAEELRRVQD